MNFNDLWQVRKGSSESLDILYELRDALIRKVFQHKHDIQVIIIPGWSLPSGVQYRLIVRLKHKHSHDDYIFVRMFIPDEDWPVAIHGHAGSIANATDLRAVLRDIIGDDANKALLHALVLTGRRRPEP